ncbi:MAG TPA: hypothetical protein VF101_08800 [Gaiellaceae bacterium]
MNPLIKRLALALLVVSVAVVSASPVGRGQSTKLPSAGPWYTPQELKALNAYSNASFAQKKALLAGGDAKNSISFITATSTASASGEPKDVAPFVAENKRGGHANPLIVAVPQTQPAAVRIVPRAGGFDWGDAGIGGAATLALVLLVAAGAALRHDGRRQEAHG